MCFAIRGMVLFKSGDVEKVEDAGSQLDPEGTETGGVTRKK